MRKCICGASRRANRATGMLDSSLSAAATIGAESKERSPSFPKTYKNLRNKQFVEKLNDMLGECLPPTSDAVVRCVNNKSQIWAPDRSSPGLSLQRGRCGISTPRRSTAWHNLSVCRAPCRQCPCGCGALTALSLSCVPTFLPRLHHKSSRPRLLHLTFDNYVTHHGRPWVPAWIRQRPPAAFHFIPTGSRRNDPIQRRLVEL